MTHEVEQGTAARFERGGYPEDVSTGGMGPCTGVLVFDRATGVTHGAHLTWPIDHERDTLDGMLADAAAELSASTDVWVYVSGCCHGSSAPQHQPTAIRPAVEQLVRSAFPTAHLDFRWPPAGVTMASMTLDPSTGHCDIEFTP